MLSRSNIDKYLAQLKEIDDTWYTGFHMVNQMKDGLNELVQHPETMIRRLQAGGSARMSLTLKAQIERIKSSQEMMRLAIQKRLLKEAESAVQHVKIAQALYAGKGDGLKKF
jgi:hypothetical protein